MPNEFSDLLNDVDAEFAGISVGDKRLNARVRSVAARIAIAPAESFPQLVASEAECEALYRLLNNDSVGWNAILEPHVVASVARGAEQGLTRVVHDTTDFAFSGDREGMGPIGMQETLGFFAHVAMAVSGGEERIPLGIVGLIPYARARGARLPLNERKLAVRKKPRAEKESTRWETLARTVGARFPTNDVIHVMDQEADDFVLVTELQRAGLRFVVRGTSDRLVRHKGESLQDVLDGQPAEVFRAVPLSARKGGGPKQRRSHPPRHERVAHLHLRWTQLVIKRPDHAQTDVASAAVWVVQVFEPAPPDGEAPIVWTLLTSEPVDDVATATEIVDHYRARWRIEEYFRALKQGCAVEKRQLESYDAMLNALAIFMPIAWRLLLLRSLARDDSPLPAAAVFDADEIAVVRALTEHKRCYALPAEPTIRDLMLAVASIGGHIRNNGEPGWIVLGRGFDDVLKACIGWRAARR